MNVLNFIVSQFNKAFNYNLVKNNIAPFILNRYDIYNYTTQHANEYVHIIITNHINIHIVMADINDHCNELNKNKAHEFSNFQLIGAFIKNKSISDNISKEKFLDECDKQSYINICFIYKYKYIYKGLPLSSL